MSESNFRLTRVFLIVLPIVLVAVGIVAFFGYFEGGQWLANLTKPRLVAGEGQVKFQGEALAYGQLLTRPENGNLKGAVGFLDEDGRFILETEIDGMRQPGAYIGKHKVIVRKDGGSMGGPAPSLVPKDYTTYDTTPLTLEISESPDQNKFDIALEGEVQGGGGPGRGGPPRPSDSSAQPSSGMTSTQFVEWLFGKYDTDKDQLLFGDELKALNEAQREAVAKSDGDGDGKLGFRDAMMAFRRLSPHFAPDADPKESEPKTPDPSPDSAPDEKQKQNEG